jgi:ABC-type dipeptide/oligopeptide/nickel transport system permease component
MGALLVGSITARDYPTIMGITVYIIVIVMSLNILIDILYGVLDPRVRV